MANGKWFGWLLVAGFAVFAYMFVVPTLALEREDESGLTDTQQTCQQCLDTERQWIGTCTSGSAVTGNMQSIPRSPCCFEIQTTQCQQLKNSG